MFGPIMQVRVGKLTIRLAPFAREDMGEFINNGGMQSHLTTRYLGRRISPTLEDEQEWFDRIRKDSARIAWGVWDVSPEGTPVLIGGSDLMNIVHDPLHQATSGSLIFRREYWGQGIATAIHKARTWYAFNELGLVRIKSAVMLPNIGSRKALERCGYFQHSIERNVKFSDGRLVHQENLECLNPSDAAWSLWWGSDEPSKLALSARAVTQEALAWASEHVTFE